MTTKKKTPLLHQASKGHSRWLRSSTSSGSRKRPTEKAIQQIDEEIVTTKEDQNLPMKRNREDRGSTSKTQGSIRATTRIFARCWGCLQRTASKRQWRSPSRYLSETGEGHLDLSRRCLSQSRWHQFRLRSKSRMSFWLLQVTDFELSTLRVEIFGERQELSPEAILNWHTP